MEEGSAKEENGLRLKTIAYIHTDFPSKFGRARSYKEQTIGTPDAGAVSTALFIRGMAEGI